MSTRTLFLLVVSGLSLSLLAGCGASRQAAASPRDEACWTPPDEVAMSMQEKAPATSASVTAERDMKSSYRPNQNDRPTSGAVHAASN